MRTAYDVLGVSRTATEEEIRAAYRRRSKVAAPRKIGDDDRAQRELNAAFEILRDRRAEYDAKLEAAGREADPLAAIFGRAHAFIDLAHRASGHFVSLATIAHEAGKAVRR